MIRDEDRPLALLVGKRARELRLLKNATQEQVAEWVRLSTQVYARLERGEMLPSLSTLARLEASFEQLDETTQTLLLALVRHLAKPRRSRS